jgi:hypothetical protein
VDVDFQKMKEEEQWCHRRGRHMRLLSESSRVKKDIDPLSGSEFPLQDTGEMEREWRVSGSVCPTSHDL